MQTITLPALRLLLSNVNSATEVELLTVTDARARKNPFGKIFKQSRIVGIVGKSYQAAVRGVQMKSFKLPTFKAAARVWGKHTGGALIDNNYLQIHVERSLFPEYYSADDVTTNLSVEQIGQYLPTSYFSNRQAQKGVSEEKQVVCVNYKLSSIKEIKMNGNHYAVEH